MTVRSATLVVAALVSMAGCSFVDRPQPAQWIPLWEDVQSVLPDLSAGEPTEAECSEALVVLRESAPMLRPTPDESIDEPVDRWLLLAEETMFECPPGTGEFTSFDDAYAELDRFADQVDVVVYDF